LPSRVFAHLGASFIARAALLTHTSTASLPGMCSACPSFFYYKTTNSASFLFFSYSQENTLCRYPQPPCHQRGGTRIELAALHFLPSPPCSK
jgi:hypothetical protein